MLRSDGAAGAGGSNAYGAAGAAGLGVRRGAGRASLATRALRTLRTALFGALLVVSRKVVSSTLQECAFLAIRTFQLLSFAILSPALDVSLMPSLAPLRWLTSLSSILSFVIWNVQVKTAMFFAAVAWAALLVALFLWAGVSFVRSSFIALWPLKVLRLMGMLSGSVLFQPLLGLLLSPWRCRDPTGAGASDFDCAVGSPGLQLGFEILGAILAVLLTCFAAIFTTSFFDSDPLSAQLCAKAHGRVDLAYVLISVLLVVSLNVFAIGAAAAVLSILMVSALLLLAAQTWYLPYYTHGWNAAYAAAFATFAYVSGCMILHVTLPGTYGESLGADSLTR